MRILVMFDLPVVTAEQRRRYVHFRKFLIKSGFLMLQESVYCKLVLNTSVENAVRENVYKNCPEEGLVQILSVTEKQFQKMDLIIGEGHHKILDSDERLVVL